MTKIPLNRQKISEVIPNIDTMDDLTDGSTYVKTENNYTDAEKTKLSGIEAGAEVNVNADWNSSSGDSQILNKPTIPTASDTAYDATSWDANTDVPTKNAVRDEIEDLWVSVGYAITEDFSVYPLVEDTRDIEGAVFLMQTSLGVTMQVTYETLLSKIQADLGL